MLDQEKAVVVEVEKVEGWLVSLMSAVSEAETKVGCGGILVLEVVVEEVVAVSGRGGG